MTPNTPRPSSALIAPVTPPAPAGPSLFTKIVAVVLTLAAVAAVFFIKDRPQLVAGAAFVATLTGLAIVYLKAYYTEEPVVKDTAGEKAIFDALTINRTEYIKGLSTLKTSLDAAAQNNTADRDGELVRKELERTRAELAGIRATVSRA